MRTIERVHREFQRLLMMEARRASTLFAIKQAEARLSEIEDLIKAQRKDYNQALNDLAALPGRD